MYNINDECACIAKIDYEQYINYVLSKYKLKGSKDESLIIPVCNDRNTTIAYLAPLTTDYRSSSPTIINRFTKWRNENRECFFTWINASELSTEEWINIILQDNHKILFIIEDLSHNKIGHIAYSDINFEEKKANIDAVLKGEITNIPSLMQFSIDTLIRWGVSVLMLKRIELSVFKHNIKAVTLYKKCGFEVIKEVPLEKINCNEKIIFKETTNTRKPNYYKLLMRWNE